MLMPEGRTKKTVKLVFQLFLIVSIISPIFSFSIENLELFNNETDFKVDDNFVYIINNERVTLLEEECENALFKEGLEQIEVKINVDYNSSNLLIKNVVINLENLRISTDNEHINITDKTLKVICDLLGVGKEVVIFE